MDIYNIKTEINIFKEKNDMFENITNTHRKALDEILITRRSVRAFSSIPPCEDDIKQIIQAGLIAPFALFPAIGKKDFRKIFIFPSNSIMIKKAANIINNRLTKYATELEEKVGDDTFVKVTNQVNSIGIIKALCNAPYLVLAGERKGIPDIPGESISYCMYNMWLKANSLKIGFKLMTHIMLLKLGDDKEFCELLDIRCGEYAFDSCALGYPDDSFVPPHMNYPDFDSNVTWF